MLTSCSCLQRIYPNNYDNQQQPSSNQDSIKGYQRPEENVKGYPRPEESMKGYPRPSESMKGYQQPQEQPTYQRPSPPPPTYQPQTPPPRRYPEPQRPSPSSAMCPSVSVTVEPPDQTIPQGALTIWLKSNFKFQVIQSKIEMVFLGSETLTQTMISNGHRSQKNFM